MSAVRPHAVFVYGTLRDPAVQQALFGRAIPGDAAVLDGWAVYESEADGFLFIKPGETDRVSGLVLQMSREELRIADAWEDVPVYRREPVIVASGGSARNVWTYTRRDGVGVEHDGASNSEHPREDVIEWAKQLRAEMCDSRVAVNDE
jgi:acyl-CoA thioesterase I